MTRIFIWGAGHCGRTLANALYAARVPVVGTWNRTREAAESGGLKPWPTFWGAERPETLDQADVVWITVPDDQLPLLTLRVDAKVLLHAAGAVPAKVLNPVGSGAVASCHPLQTFAAAMGHASDVAGITFGLEGDSSAVATAQTLVESMGATHFTVEDEAAKALYHAACCVASNALVALADRAVNLFEAAGVDRVEALRALGPLIVGTAANLARANEAADALTGPIRRGDVGAVQNHLAAISERIPAELPTYRALMAEILRLHPDAKFDDL